MEGKRIPAAWSIPAYSRYVGLSRAIPIADVPSAFCNRASNSWNLGWKRYGVFSLAGIWTNLMSSGLSPTTLQAKSVTTHSMSDLKRVCDVSGKISFDPTYPVKQAKFPERGEWLNYWIISQRDWPRQATK